MLNIHGWEKGIKLFGITVILILALLTGYMLQYQYHKFADYIAFTTHNTVRDLEGWRLLFISFSYFVAAIAILFLCVWYGNNIIRERRGDRKALLRPFLFWVGVTVCILGMVTAALAQSTAPLKMSAIPVGLFFLIYFVFFKLREDE